MTMMSDPATLEYLDVNPSVADTPTAVYGKFRFLYENGVGSLIARSGYPSAQLPGTLTMVDAKTWRLDGDDETWMIQRIRGCSCQQTIKPK